jgi:ATP-binding cassette subfamily F protein 3
MKRLATNIIEVRGGTAKNYGGDYDAYLYYINKEIDDGERLRSPPRGSNKKSDATKSQSHAVVDAKKIKKELKNIERTIRGLDAQRTAINDQLMQSTDPQEALKLHNEIKAIEMEMGKAEERWLELTAFEE